MNNTEKLDQITAKMNKITAELTKNVEFSEELLVTSEGLDEYIKDLSSMNSAQAANAVQTVQNTELLEIDPTDTKYELAPITEIAGQIVNPNDMVQDFEYMRGMLREATQNSRRVLSSVTEELMLSDGDSRAALILAFSELNKAQIESVKLFIQSYRELSTILLNLSKVQNAGTPQTVHTTNVLNVEGSGTTISSADIVKRLVSQ